MVKVWISMLHLSFRRPAKIQVAKVQVDQEVMLVGVKQFLPSVVCGVWLLTQELNMFP